MDKKRHGRTTLLSQDPVLAQAAAASPGAPRTVALRLQLKPKQREYEAACSPLEH